MFYRDHSMVDDAVFRMTFFIEFTGKIFTLLLIVTVLRIENSQLYLSVGRAFHYCNRLNRGLSDAGGSDDARL